MPMPLFVLLIFLSAAPLLAQEESASPTPAAEPSPSPSPSPGEDVIPLPPESGAAETPIVSEAEVPGLPDSSFTDPNAVVPEAAPSEIPAAPPSGPSEAEIQRKIKVRYQEVRVQVEKDPAVKSLLDQANAAKTFEDERAALREYYRLLFKKIRKIDKELTEHCNQLEDAYIRRLAQTKLEPTIPLNPPPKPEPLAN